MGNLASFKTYLDDRHAVVGGVETALCALQEKFETFFAGFARTGLRGVAL